MRFAAVGLSGVIVDMGKFQLVCLAALAINTVLLNLQFNLLHLLHMNRYVANAISTVVVTGWKF
jgi:putative flippase GtrA